ncbi:MAG: hypothetical protein WBN40_00875 [Pseudomonadales bacterium]
MNQSASSLSPAQIRANRIKLLVLWLLPFGLMAIAGVCYYLVQTGQMQIGSKNHGVLLSPPLQLHEQLGKLSVLDAEGGAQLLVESPWRNKWTLVVPAFDDCAERCSEALYLTRQLHIRLDKNANRVQRVLLAGPAAQAAVGSEAFNHMVNTEHSLLRRIVYSDASAVASLQPVLRADSGEQARFFIVDPDGWAMMYYLDEHDGNAMLADLKHLLKFSGQR